MHQGISGEITQQALLQIALRDFGVTEESPTISTVAASYPLVSMYTLNELRFPFCNDRVFHRNQHGTLAKVRFTLVDNHRHAPVVPRSQIGGRVGKLREKRKDSGREGPDPGGHESNLYA